MAEETEYKLVTGGEKTLNDSRNFSGTGTAYYPNGDVYQGMFVSGLRQGDNGIYTYHSLAKPNDDGAEPPKEVYTGQWVNNLKHGIGKQNYNGMGDYYGHWEKGQKHGEGVMIYDNKDIYSGQWKNGKKDGQGTYIFAETGMKFIGLFKGGNLTNGKWQYPNGSYFEGSFDNNQPKGKGRWHFENGNVVEGLYTQMKRADVNTDEIKLTWKTLSDITAAI